MDLPELINNANYEHSRKVSAISGLMAEKAGLPQSGSRDIAQAALYHDVGKSAVPPDIINKPASLTPAEYEIIKTHTTAGVRQINDVVRLLTIAGILAGQHHEHVDGRGYHHLSGDKIHPYAKLVACADVFDALYSQRPYKERWDLAKIRRYFITQSGNQFDPVMVDVLFSILDDVLALYKNE